MKLGTETNSVMNHLMSGTKGAPQPAVGMGATRLGWTYRNPATIVEVRTFKSGARTGQVRAVAIQDDHAKRIDNNSMSESQEYEFTPNRNGAVQWFKVDKNGSFKGDGGRLRIGERDKYYDFSF